MVNDKEAVKKAFNRFVTQQAREQECCTDEVINVIYNYIVDIIINGDTI